MKQNIIFRVRVRYEYEGYNGYDKRESTDLLVSARSFESATKKATKYVDKNYGRVLGCERLDSHLRIIE